LRIVLDTNVVISALVFPGGTPEAVHRLVLEGRVALVSSPTLLAELGRILATKFAWSVDRAEEAVAQLARFAHVVTPTTRIERIEEDPADDRVLEAAVEGGADVIVSGDRHLLRLGSWQGIAIERPAQFIERFADHGP
jgi:putative PIN family toxin of toxin-antitoxin system